MLFTGVHSHVPWRGARNSLACLNVSTGTSEKSMAIMPEDIKIVISFLYMLVTCTANWLIVAFITGRLH